MTALAKVEEVHDAQFQLVRPVMDLRDGISLMPVEEQNKALDEYDKRRSNFRKWLLAHLVQGVHYGFSPGCEPKLDDDGNLLQWNKKANKYVTISKDSWQVRPSLYKAGAQLLVDLLRMRITFEADTAAWQQLGSKPGMFVFKCILINPATGSPVGEGRGVFEVGEKGMNSNAAIKMAQKRAMVDAVITTVAVCADLFTQDMEDEEKPRAEHKTAAKDVVEIVDAKPSGKAKIWADFLAEVKAEASRVDAPEGTPINYQGLWAEVMAMSGQAEPGKALEWFTDNAEVGLAEVGNGEVQYTVKLKECR